MAAVRLRIGGDDERGSRITIRIDGEPIPAHAGESLATALLAAGVRPRGLFCAMGVCQECIVLLEGRRIEACRVTLRAGMEFQRAP